MSIEGEPNTGGMNSEQLEQALGDDVAQKQAETLTHEQQMLEAKERQLDAMLDQLDRLGIANITAQPDAWPQVCAIANLALEVSLGVAMHELADMLKVDITWLMGLPALLAKKERDARGVADPQKVVEKDVDPRRTIQIGDVVRIRSGGPAMTVIHEDEKNAECRTEDGKRYKCAWFTKDGAPNESWLPRSALHLA